MTTSWIAARNSSVCSLSQSRTQPPVRPGANPSSDPGPSTLQSTNEVSHGSDRRRVSPSSSQRTDRNRVSSIPNLPVDAGSGNHFAAAVINARCAVGHDTSNSAATSETARFPAAIARASLSRSRSVSLARGRIASLAWVNDLRGQSASRQASRRFRHHNSTAWPLAGRSLIRRSGRSFTRALITPHAGHGASLDRISMMILTRPGPIRATPSTSNSSSIPNSTEVASDTLVASLLDVVGDL